MSDQFLFNGDLRKGQKLMDIIDSNRGDGDDDDDLGLTPLDGQTATCIDEVQKLILMRNME